MTVYEHQVSMNTESTCPRPTIQDVAVETGLCKDVETTDFLLLGQPEFYLSIQFYCDLTLARSSFESKLDPGPDLDLYPLHPGAVQLVMPDG